MRRGRATSNRTYIHGYTTPEQQRLIKQAEHWRDELILPGTQLAPGTRLLEVGCGVGAVLGVLGKAFPGIRITGVDIEQRQIEFAREHLARLGLEAELKQGDATCLPLPDASQDHVWFQWVLEHLKDPVAALREARRVLVPGGRVTAIEVDYNTIAFEPSTPAMDAFRAAAIKGMEDGGRSDAGTHVARWLEEAEFVQVDPGEMVCDFREDELKRQAAYFAEIWQSAVPSLVQLPGVPDEPELLRGVADLRALHEIPGAHLGWTIHKAQAVAP